MTFEPRTYETECAVLERSRPDLLEIHYRHGALLTNESIAEVSSMRRAVMGTAYYGTLSLVPEDVDYRLETMQRDHMAEDRSQGRVIASAVVARANMMEMMVKLYFSYFPQLHRILVTDKEDEARRWLDAQLAEHGRTGS
jgi:hypothetical protein